MKNMSRKINHRYLLTGFTLIELLVFIVMIVCVVAGANIAQEKFGWKFAWLLGGFSGLLLFLLGGLGFAALIDCAFGSGLPKCRDETCCKPDDYEIRQFGKEYNYVCQHGVRYMRRGKRFVIVSEDGTESPYLIWRSFRGWFPEQK